MIDFEIEQAVKRASDAQLLTELIKGAFDRNIIFYRILRLNIPAEMKISLLTAADSGENRLSVLNMINSLDPETGHEAETLTDLSERFDWQSIGKAAAESIPANRHASPKTPTDKVPTPKKKPESWVYFIESEGSSLVKIGYSISPEKRLKELQTSSPETLVMLGTIPGGKSKEIELHKKFAKHRERGEWFHKAPELAKFIERETTKS